MMSYKGCFKTVCLSALVWLYSAGTAQATEYELVWTPPQKLTGDCFSAGNGIAGSLKRLETRYNSSLHLLSWEATFSACNGSYLPDGFRLAMNNGENPKAADAKELAFLYFDASHMFSGLDQTPTPAPDHPILTVYEYTGANSHKTGAPIVSNHPDAPPSDFIIDIYAHNNPDGTRSLGFVIDASVIKDFRNTEKWWGVGYNSLIGFWWHPTTGTSTTYCNGSEVTPAYCTGNAGYLKLFQYKKLGWYDTQDMDTNKLPFCYTSFENSHNDAGSDQNVDECVSVEIGEEFEALVVGDDGDDDQLVPTYSGTPAGSTMSVGGNPLTATNTTPYDVPVNLLFSWTPQLADAGSNHLVTVEFSDDGFPNVSESKGTTSCSIPLCVPNNEPPVCDLQVITEKAGPSYQCVGEKTDIEFSATGSTDPEQGELSYSWKVVCEDVDSQPVQEMFETSEKGNTATLSVGTPWEPGKKVTCKVVVTVLDNIEQQSQCATQVVVDPCVRDCLDQPNGDAQVDECGVCNGTNECFDCLGVPNGDADYDACGVCEGSNACLDCFGVPFGDSELDRCGVCDGDGNGCLDCDNTDIQNLQFELDGGADAQRNLIRRATKRLLQKDDSAEQLRYIRKIRKQAAELYLKNWTLTWSLPQIITQCTNIEFCVASDNGPTLDEYESNSQKLFTLNQGLIKRIRKVAGSRKRSGKRRGIKMIQAARKQHQENLERSGSVPKSGSDCTK